MKRPSRLVNAVAQGRPAAPRPPWAGAGYLRRHAVQAR
jgi:hypothetical protein